jgi:hypothetical protein
MELNSSWKLVVLIELQLSCIVYMVSCNFATHATCLLKLMAYKYSELQASFATQKLSCKANCKTTFFSQSDIWKHYYFQISIRFKLYKIPPNYCPRGDLINHPSFNSMKS